NSTLSVTNSAFSDNRGVGTAAGIGILNIGGTTSVTNTTFAHNTLQFETICTAIANVSGKLVLISSTFAENFPRPPGSATAAALFGDPSATTLIQNTILARNSSDELGQNCSGTITSMGNNILDEVSGCNIILQPSDQIGDPGLGMF